MQSLVRFELVNGDHTTCKVNGDEKEAFYSVVSAIESAVLDGVYWVAFEGGLFGVNVDQLRSFEVLGEIEQKQPGQFGPKMTKAIAENAHKMRATPNW
jgi:hypothetical protein